MIPILRNPSAWLLLALAFVWIAYRLTGTPSPPPLEIVARSEAVRVSPSAATGCFVVLGLPDDDAPPFFRRSAVVAARTRLLAEVAAAHDDLSELATRIAARVEIFPDDGVTGLRLSGVLVPFYDQDADRLARARRTGPERPREALETVAQILEGRLAEPQEGFALEDTVQRRDMMRILRDAEDALVDRESEIRTAVLDFRDVLVADARHAEGPFRRRGRGRLVEILMASLIGVALAQLLRPQPPIPRPLSLVTAPVFALAGVLLLEGSALLPIDPVAGIALAYLPLAFALGFGTPSALAAVTRRRRPPSGTPVPEAAPAVFTGVATPPEAVPEPPPAAPLAPRGPMTRPERPPTRVSRKARTEEPRFERPRTEREIVEDRPAVVLPPVAREPARPGPAPSRQEERLPIFRKRRRGA